MSAAPTSWQLGEDFKGGLLPVLKDVKQLKAKIELEISHKRDEMEFGSVAVYKTNNPTPEDPQKIRKLGDNVIRAIQEAVDLYERLCLMEANKGAVQETGQVTTTRPDIEENQTEEIMVLPTPETESPSPFIPQLEDMEYQETTVDEKPTSPNSRPRLKRLNAVENEDTIDLGRK